MAERANVIAFAIIMGQFIKNNPYTNHKATPEVNILYIGSEMPDKSRVLNDLYACGTKANVVSAAAKLPTKLAKCETIIYLTLNKSNRMLIINYFCIAFVDKKISRRKHIKPQININIALINSNETILEGNKLISAPRNKVAMIKHINNAETTLKVIAECTQRERRKSVAISSSR